MSEKDLNKEAYKQAEAELFEKKVESVKNLILETLNKMESKKKQKERIDEEIRILKMDLDDLRNGKFDKIEERIEKSKVARGVSINPQQFVGMAMTDLVYRPTLGVDMSYGQSVNAIGIWQKATSGTYTTTNGKAYYL